MKNYKVVHDVFTTDTEPLEQRVQECPVACDTDTTSGHGTHVAGTILGDGTASSGYHTGVAPGAGLVSYGVGEGIAMLWALLAMDHLLAHPELNVVAVNNSWGPTDDALRFDPEDPRNIATKALHDAGITVVFSAGNSGPTRRTRPASPTARPRGRPPRCMINQLSVAPWTLSIANTRTDQGTLPGEQTLNYTLLARRPDAAPGRRHDDHLPADARGARHQHLGRAQRHRRNHARHLHGHRGGAAGVHGGPARGLPALRALVGDEHGRAARGGRRGGGPVEGARDAGAPALTRRGPRRARPLGGSDDQERQLLRLARAARSTTPPTCPIEEFGGTTDQPYDELAGGRRRAGHQGRPRTRRRHGPDCQGAQEAQANEVASAGSLPP